VTFTLILLLLLRALTFLRIDHGLSADTPDQDGRE
jgi:hypothetical protein